MSGDLNLLPSQAKFRAKRMKIKAKINTFLWVFSGVWMGLIILVMGIFFILKLVSSQSNKSYQKTLNQYKIQLESMSVNQKVRYQAKVVGKVLAGRFKYGETIEMINGLFGENVEVSNLEIKSQKVFVVTGKLIDGRNMDMVENQIRDINGGYDENFAGAKLNSVKFDPKFGWSFNVEVSLK